MDLFVIKEGKLVLNNEQILLTKAYRDIYEGDETVAKTKAFKYFNYIYQICDYKSLPNQEGYNKQEAHEYAIEVADLPPGYKPTQAIIDAMKEYRKGRYSVLRESVQELKRSFSSIIKVIANARGRLQDTLNIDHSEKTEKEQNEIIGSSIDLITKLISLSTSLNKQIELLSDTLKKIHKEELDAKNSEVRGDKEFLDSYDGDPDIEG